MLPFNSKLQAYKHTHTSKLSVNPHRISFSLKKLGPAGILTPAGPCAEFACVRLTSGFVQQQPTFAHGEPHQNQPDYEQKQRPWLRDMD